MSFLVIFEGRKILKKCFPIFCKKNSNKYIRCKGEKLYTLGIFDNRTDNSRTSSILSSNTEVDASELQDKLEEIICLGRVNVYHL